MSTSPVVNMMRKRCSIHCCITQSNTHRGLAAAALLGAFLLAYANAHADPLPASPERSRHGARARHAGRADALAPAAAARRLRLQSVKSWRYQLRNIDINEIAASDDDLLVIDYAPDRVHGVELPFSSADVARMQSRPAGGRKLLLAYLSIGEAERYRTYWNNAWYDAPTRPRWLLEANPQWIGNFPVRFWDRQWQSIVFGSPQAYLERILSAGFDGVYLDRADVFQDLETERTDAEDEMACFIVKLAEHARSIRPDVLIVMQNAEELVRRADVRLAIDGLAKEDLLFGVAHDEAPNPPDMVGETLADLAIAHRSKLPVLVVEYLSRQGPALRAIRRISGLGYLPLITERSLGTLRFEPQRTDPVKIPEALPGAR